MQNPLDKPPPLDTPLDTPPRLNRMTDARENITLKSTGRWPYLLRLREVPSFIRHITIAKILLNVILRI